MQLHARLTIRAKRHQRQTFYDRKKACINLPVTQRPPKINVTVENKGNFAQLSHLVGVGEGGQMSVGVI